MPRTLSSIFATAAVVSLTSLAAAPAAHAALIEFPAANSRSFIELFEIDSGRSLCNLTCSLVASSGQSVSQPAFGLVGGPRGANFVNAQADVSPSAMHAFVSGNIGVEYDLAFADTYTVHGGTGPFAITAHLDADAIASSLHFDHPNVDEIAGANIVVRIGDFSVDPNVVFQPGVTAFTGARGNSAVFSQGCFNCAPFSQVLTASTSYTRMVNPGDVFDLGYELTAAFALGTIDASHTATIDFDLPDGVFLNASSGASFGNVPTAPGGGVPEPEAWTLMIGGFGLAGAALRRRPRLA